MEPARFWSGLVGSLVCLLVSAGGAAAQTLWSDRPVADAFVTTGPTNNLSANNYGAAGALAVAGASAARAGSGFRGDFASVLRFDLAGARADFDATYGPGQWMPRSMTLRLTTTSANNAIFNDRSTGEIAVRWMRDDSWAAGTGSPNALGADGITYATLPGYLGVDDEWLGTFVFDRAASGADGAQLTLGLALSPGPVGDLLAGHPMSLALVAASDSVSYLFNSADFPNAERRPRLTIDAVAVPEPAPWALGILALGLAWCRARHANR